MGKVDDLLEAVRLLEAKESLKHTSESPGLDLVVYELFRQALETDTDYEFDDLIHAYPLSGDNRLREDVDMVFIQLCGWSLNTLIRAALAKLGVLEPDDAAKDVLGVGMSKATQSRKRATPRTPGRPAVGTERTPPRDSSRAARHHSGRTSAPTRPASSPHLLPYPRVHSPHACGL